MDTPTENTLTPRQLELIGKLRCYGYGWAKFAGNVEKQGWCSPRQERTMENMVINAARIKESIATRPQPSYSNYSTRRRRNYSYYSDQANDWDYLEHADPRGQYDGEGFW